MKFFGSVILAAIFASALTFLAVEQSANAEMQAYERHVKLKERKFEREIAKLNRKLESASEPASVAQPVSMAAFELRGNPQAARLTHESSGEVIKRLEEEKVELLAALDETQSKLLRQREKKPTLTVHYFRADKDYYGWGVHTVGNAVTTRTSWQDPIEFKYLSEFGVSAKIKLHKDHKTVPLDFLVHRGPEVDCDPDPEVSYTKDSKLKLSVDASKHKQVYLVSGIAKVFLDKDAALKAMQSL